MWPLTRAKQSDTIAIAEESLATNCGALWKIICLTQLRCSLGPRLF
jgi:hypothetical protein